MSLSLSVAPTVEPISLSEAKAHVRVEVDDDNDLLTALIQAARERAEALTARQFITATYVWTLDAFPTEIEFPRPPLLTVTSIAYLDTAGVSQTVSASTVYQVDAPAGPHADRGTATLRYGMIWPPVYPVSYPITITFTAGYGPKATDVPAVIRQAMLLLIGTWYEQREDLVVGTITAEIPGAATALLKPYYNRSCQVAA